MKRLTEKNNGNTPYNQTEYPYLAGADINDITNKLGKLEDIEEEIGIPLEVLFKALKDGIYNRNGYIDYVYLDYALLEKEYCLMDVNNRVFKSKDYRKTWWLTREELE